MLSQDELAYILEKAYIPEHLPGYFQTFSKMEAFIEDKLLYYKLEDVISFIGYPLGAVELYLVNQNRDRAYKEMSVVLEKVVEKYKPKEVKIIAPIEPPLKGYKLENTTVERDSYSVLDVQNLRIPSKVKNMVSRAGRELEITISRDFSIHNHKLLLEFLKQKRLSDTASSFFHHIPDYIAHSESAVVINAYRSGRRTMDELLGYNIVDFSHGGFCFYLFNITGDEEDHVPGTSDLLLYEMVQLAKKKGKKYINMGLGINKGIKKFKEKWGAKNLIGYNFMSYQKTAPWFAFFYSRK
ncbi:hypothetical protein [Desulfitibacter alkalitolerans]|uniref:hypothetical protein n=1 Tax=Desulfitibacter alkalitolerans TaxID=264641 RepID=UPI000483AFC2|nr:hypothetical protein [Desulfitibacter alkalitolerans]